MGGGTNTSIELGDGRPAGNPIGTITLASAGAGSLTGVYQYAYTEGAIGGQTGLSPIASFTASHPC